LLLRRGSGERGVRLGREQIAEGVALGVRELRTETIGTDDSLTLFGRHGAQIDDGTGNHLAAVARHAGKALHGCTILLPLRCGHSLQCLVAFEQAIALLRGHTVELDQPVTVALLHLRGQIVEAGFTFEIVKLLLDGLALVVLHPLLEVFLIGPGGGCTCAGANWRVICLTRYRLRLAPQTRSGRTYTSHARKQREGQTKPNCAGVPHGLF
jgi:hypothetical protein